MFAGGGGRFHTTLNSTRHQPFIKFSRKGYKVGDLIKSKGS